MAKIYYRRIINGTMTIEDVPARWRDEVQALLNGETQY
jgi:Zn-dependent M32 family carboxypeptidase